MTLHYKDGPQKEADHSEQKDVEADRKKGLRLFVFAAGLQTSTDP